VWAGTRFPPAPYSGGVYCLFDEVEQTIYPTAKLWHAPACGCAPAHVVHATGEPRRPVVPSLHTVWMVCYSLYRGMFLQNR
jgi:hypothetical protein